MKSTDTVRRGLAASGMIALAASAIALSPLTANAEDGWHVKSYAEVQAPVPAANGPAELAALKGLVATRTAEDVARFQWWSVGGPAYRWNEIILDEMLEGFVTMPLAARHLALFHTAIDDAMAAAREQRKPGAPARPATVDSALKGSAGASAPSEHAAAAAAAAEIIGYLFPARAAALSARAEEAIRVRLLAGAEYPIEVAAGRAIGAKVAALAIARGRADGSDAKWTGTVPTEPGQWRGTNPVAPAAGTWKTWVLAHAGEVRPAAPPPLDSERVRKDLAELKDYQRTPKSNHRATYWEVFGGARVHALWNEIARTKILESGASPELAARALVAVNVALADAGIACWEAKYFYWYPRPGMVDAEVKTVFNAPNHPSYPSAHACLSTTASTVLARFFPRDAERLLAIGTEALEARIWAGIHYRFDLEAGAEIGRKVAEKTLARALPSRMN